MRIILIGQAAFGAAVCEALSDQNEEIIAVYTPTDKPGGHPDPLTSAALERGIAVVQPATYKDDRVFSAYGNLAPDLTVMAFVTDIIPDRYFSVPTHGTINYHPSLLPRHRGASAINWAVIMGDTRTGLSIFWPDGGIDTGALLLQKEIVIGLDDTTGTLYFNHLFPMGVAAIKESIDLIKAGQAPRLAQNEDQATYEPPCDDRVAQIDWRQPARDIYNLVRGCDPQPGAYVPLRGGKLRCYGNRLSDTRHDAQPGTVITIDGQGLHVALDQGALIIGKMRTPEGKKMAAAECAAALGLQPGDKL